MKALCFYLATIAIAANVAGNLASSTAQGLEAIQQQRTEQLCKVNPSYC